MPQRPRIANGGPSTRVGGPLAQNTRLAHRGVPRARPLEGRVEWSHLRLKDRIKPGVRGLFVGINPGVRSAMTGHHFAGFSNRFWKLLSESGLVPEPMTFEADHRLPEFGFGITNLIARPSPGIDDLAPS